MLYYRIGNKGAEYRRVPPAYSFKSPPSIPMPFGMWSNLLFAKVQRKQECQAEVRGQPASARP